MRLRTHEEIVKHIRAGLSDVQIAELTHVTASTINTIREEIAPSIGVVSVPSIADLVLPAKDGTRASRKSVHDSLRFMRDCIITVCQDVLVPRIASEAGQSRAPANAAIALNRLLEQVVTLQRYLDGEARIPSKIPDDPNARDRLRKQLLLMNASHGSARSINDMSKVLGLSSDDVTELLVRFEDASNSDVAATASSTEDEPEQGA